MKKLSILFLSLALAGTLTACGDDKVKPHGHDGDVADDGGSDADTDGGGLSTSELVTAAEGGEISLADANLEIPAGALDADTTITVEQLSADSVPGGENVVGKVYDFGPDGTTFNVPVTLTLEASDIPDGAVIAFLDGADWITLADSVVSAGKVTATTTHFTRFAILIVDGVQIGGSCEGNFEACGGDLVNTDWLLVDSDEDCATVTGIDDILGQFQNCNDKTIAVTASFSGTISFKASTYNLNVVANIGGQITVAKSCIGGECDGENFIENEAGKCVSAGNEPDDPNPENGTYTVNNDNQIAFVASEQGDDDHNDEIIDYCITGQGQNRKLAVRLRSYTDETKTALEVEARFHAVPNNQQ